MDVQRGGQARKPAAQADLGTPAPGKAPAHVKGTADAIPRQELSQIIRRSER